MRMNFTLHKTVSVHVLNINFVRVIMYQDFYITEQVMLLYSLQKTFTKPIHLGTLKETRTNLSTQRTICNASMQMVRH